MPLHRQWGPRRSVRHGRHGCAITVALLVSGITSFAMASAVRAQDAIRPVHDGDGRVHGAEVLPVSHIDLQPGAVQTINLRPRFVLGVEFPYPVFAVHAGDADVVSASITGAKVILNSKKDTIAETNLLVLLGDANMTMLDFRLRVDSTQPQVDVIRATDPLGQHLNQTEAAMARRLRAADDGRVDQLTEARVEQRLLLAGPAIMMRRSTSIGHVGDRMGLTIESAQSFPGDDGRARLYLRYQIRNETVTPMTDLVMIVRVVTPHHRWLLFEGQKQRELNGVQDVRATRVVPAGQAAYGLLILEPLALARHETLSVEAVAFNNQRHVVVDGVFEGH